MAEQILKNARIQQLNDTAEALAAVGATKAPLKGEIVIENDTNKMKIGDGVTPYNDLPYFGGVEAQNFNVTPTGEQTDVEAIAAAVASAEIHAGDTAIVKRAIANDKFSYTAYVYNGTNWEAMDGNYRADNVYFDDDITYTVAIGTLAKPSGSAKFSAKGKNVEQVLSSLMAQEANPNKSNPAVTLTVTGEGTYEIGTKKTLSYTASLSAGSYTYGPATGITATSWKVSCTGFAAGSEQTTATGTWENVVAELQPKYVTAVANYGDGAIPVTNLGNEYPAGQIKAGSANKSSNGIKGVRYMFYGVVTDADFALNSANIRGLSKTEAAARKTLTTFTAGANAKKVIVAVPSGYNVSKVLLPSAMNADATADFVKQSTSVQVEGANGYTAAAYDVWVYAPASIPSSQSYAITIA